MFLSDEGPKLETVDYTIRIGSTPTFLYFDLYLYSAYEFASMPIKQWLQVEVGDEIIMHLGFSLIFHILDFKPLFVRKEANSGSVI